MLKFFKKLKKDKRGITLMEMVVAVAVFSVVIMMATDLYFVAQQSERKTTAIQKVQSDARYSLEAIAREIRVDKIDYQYYSNLTNQAEDTLSLFDSDGCRILFRRSLDSSGICQGMDSCLAVGLPPRNNGVCDNNLTHIVWTSLTPKNIIVDILHFYISPTVDPFAENSEINEQPRVTIVFTSHNFSAASRPEDEKSLTIQTTVSSRFYGK